MSRKIGHRAVAAVLAGTLGMGTVAVANAGSVVEEAIGNRKDLRGKIVDLHQLKRERRVELHQAIKTIEARLDKFLRIGAASNRARAHHFRRHQIKRIGKLEHRERAMVRGMRNRVKVLRERRSDITEWIESLPLQTCPMGGEHEVSDNFGIMHNHAGDKHVHMGVDIMAATGTPIIAPFDGTAVANPSEMGGEAVEVYGADGYVYNAHLEAYGELGEVQTGDVVGYVGSSGNATAPHNHFEWHPADGEAIDPFEVLLTVC